MLLLCRKRKKNFFSFSDLILPCFCIAHAGGRIGCLLVGCCYGVAKGELCLAGSHTYQGTFAVTYANGIQRLPVPLMEAIFLVLLSAVLLLILPRKDYRIAAFFTSLLLTDNNVDDILDHDHLAHGLSRKIRYPAYPPAESPLWRMRCRLHFTFRFWKRTVSRNVSLTRLVFRATGKSSGLTRPLRASFLKSQKRS